MSHPLHRQETRPTLTPMAKAGVNFDCSPPWKRFRPSTAPHTRPTLRAEPKHAALAAPSQAPCTVISVQLPSLQGSPQSLASEVPLSSSCCQARPQGHAGRLKSSLRGAQKCTIPRGRPTQGIGHIIGLLIPRTRTTLTCRNSPASEEPRPWAATAPNHAPRGHSCAPETAALG